MGPIIPGQYAFGGFEGVKSEGAGRDLLQVALADARLKGELAGIGLNNIGANLRQASVNDTEQRLLDKRLEFDARNQKRRWAGELLAGFEPPLPTPPDPYADLARHLELSNALDARRRAAMEPAGVAVSGVLDSLGRAAGS